jgi:hypothetical protein
MFVEMDNFAAELASKFEHKYVEHGTRETDFRRRRGHRFTRIKHGQRNSMHLFQKSMIHPCSSVAR